MNCEVRDQKSERLPAFWILISDFRVLNMKSGPRHSAISAGRTVRAAPADAAFSMSVKGC